MRSLTSYTENSYQRDTVEFWCFLIQGWAYTLGLQKLKIVQVRTGTISPCFVIYRASLKFAQPGLINRVAHMRVLDRNCDLGESEARRPQEGEGLTSAFYGFSSLFSALFIGCFLKTWNATNGE